MLTFNYWNDTPVLDLCIQPGHPCHTYGGCPPGTLLGHRLDRNVQLTTGAHTRLVKQNTRKMPMCISARGMLRSVAEAWWGQDWVPSVPSDAEEPAC